MTDSEPRSKFTRREALKIGGVVGGAALLTSCGINPGNPAPTETPKKPTDTLLPTETEAPPDLRVNGHIESNMDNPERETIKFNFSDGFKDKKKPLFERNDIVVFKFYLDSEIPPINMVASAPNMLGVNISVSDLKKIDDSPANGFSIPEMAKVLQKQADSFGRKLEIGENDLGIIKHITFIYGIINGKFYIQLELPNTRYSYTDENGKHEVNPLQRFLNGEMGIEMERIEKPEEGSVISPPTEPIIVSGLEIYSGKQNKVVYQQKPGEVMELRPPSKIKIESGREAEKGERTNHPTPTEESRWIKEWEVNKEITIRDWWEDMVSKGYIKVDSTARQYAGKRIDSMLDNNLVPNPKDYYSKGKAFVGNCTSTLRNLVSESQGHITISSEAFAQIPGGEACQIFVK